MLIQKQPNKWSCLPTAVAIATNLPVEIIIKEIGHDGSEIIWDGDFPWKAFDAQETIIALWNLGFSAVVLYSEIETSNMHSEGTLNNNYDLTKYLNDRGIVIGLFGDKSHAAAFNSGIIYDPNGMTYHYNDSIKIDEIWLIKKHCSESNQND